MTRDKLFTYKEKQIVLKHVKNALTFNKVLKLKLH